MHGADDLTLRPDDRVGRGGAQGLRRGEAVGRYVVLEELGQGAMGRVYLAYDPRLDRRVALKQVRLEHYSDALREGARLRLLREAQALARLGHPHVVGVHDVVTRDEDLLVALEHVDGTTLTQWASDEANGSQARLEVLRQAAEGLWAAHRAGIVHRDFKPDNVMVDASRGAKVVDFGLARALASEESLDEPRSEHSSPDGPMGLAWTTQTEAGGLVGTPTYMAPEQLAGYPASAATDQYAFCVTAFEVLFGQRPFEGRSLAALTERKEQGQIESPPADSPIPKRIRDAITRGLSPDPKDRFASIEQLINVFKHRARSTKTSLAIGGAFLAGSVAMAGFALISGDDEELCASGASEISQAWNDEARDQIVAALAAPAASSQEHISQQVVATLDAYAQQWVEHRNDACRATQRGGQSAELLDRRIACLDMRKRELATTVAVLGIEDAQTRTRAVDVAMGMPPLEPCSDSIRLLAAVELPTAEHALAVAEVRGEIASARTLNRAGKYDEALAQAQRAHTKAVEIAYRPAVAEALLWRGFLEDRIGDPAAAEKTLQQAAWLGQRLGHDPVAARAMTELVFVIGHHLRRDKDALLWAQFADAVVERLGDPVALARLHSNRGAAEMEGGRYYEARLDFQRAIELRIRLLGPRHPDTISTQVNLATLEDEAGEAELAKAQYDEVLRLHDEVFGRLHPRTAGTLVNYGGFLLKIGNVDRGRRFIEQALGIYAHSDPGGPLYAMALENLGAAYYHADRLPEAMEHLVEALTLRERALGPAHADVLYLHLNIGGVAYDLGDFVRARDEMTLALQGLTEALGPDDLDVADVLMSLAVLENAQERYVASAAAAERAVKIRRKALRAGHPELGNSLAWLAVAQLELGELKAAQSNGREAVAILSVAPQGEAKQVTRARWVAAAAGHRLGTLDTSEVEGLAQAAANLPEDAVELRRQVEHLLTALQF